MEPDALDEAVIADTVAAVFSQGDYARSLRESLFARFLALLYRLWLWFRGLARTDPGMYWASVIVLTLILVAVVARVAWIIRARQVRAARLAAEAGGRPGAVALRDPWIVAQQEAARGNFTDAAHALYLALLEALARRGQLRLHPAKTIGDYVRELRGKSSGFFDRFREFSRSYEWVVYGLGTCDRERFERLRELAMPILEGAR